MFARSRLDRGRLRRRFLALLVGFALAFAALELSLQLGALFVRADRSGDGVEPAFALCVGDSNTFGLNVAAELAYPAQLERLLRERGASPARVVNRGLPGKPTWVVARELAADLQRYRPRVVLIWCGVNDRNLVRPEDRLDHWLSRSRAVTLLRRTWKNAEEQMDARAVRASNRLTEDAVEQVEPSVGRVRFADRENEARTFLMHFGSPSPELVTRWIDEDLASIAEQARAAGAAPIVCLYFEDNAIFAPINQALAASARRLGLPLVDPRPTFAAALARVDRSQIVFPDCHLKGPGYAILVRLIVDAAVDAGLLDGPRIENALEPLAALSPLPPRLSAWIENGETKGVEVAYTPNVRAQLLLSTRSGLTNVRWRKDALCVSPDGESAAQLPLEADVCFKAVLARAAEYTVDLGESGSARIAIPRAVLKLPHVFAVAVLIDDEPQITAVSPRIRLR